MKKNIVYVDFKNKKVVKTYNKLSISNLISLIKNTFSKNTKTVNNPVFPTPRKRIQ